VNLDVVSSPVSVGPQTDSATDETQPKRFLRSDLGRYVPFVSVAAAVFLVDQWSKVFVTQYVQSTGQGQVSLFGGAVLIRPIQNPGAAFGILPNQTWLLTVVAAVIIGALVVSYRRLARGPLSLRIGLAMILGGAVGNLLDRVRLGSVRDFIDLRWWPVFNVADSCIVMGVTVLILTLLVQAEHRAERR